jgi:predicted DNA-binding transcriptional regulator AlpA
MAYNTEKLKKQALAAIDKHKLFFIEDVAAFLPCSRSTFYEHFSDKSDDRKEIDELLERNRIEVKTSMRSKWYKSEAPALQLSLYKLIATTDERNALSMSKVDVTSGGDKITWNEVRTYDKPESE